MSGICGIVGRSEPSTIEAMANAMTHRGPDGLGVYAWPEGAVRLGHRQLGNAVGVQPMQSADGSLILMYDGRIYNHLELRAELEDLGHQFQTDHSEAETLLAAWAEWGERMLTKLNGMFAFAILDTTRRRLTLARDRFGEKPLFYCRLPSDFAFASELQAFRHWSAFTPNLDADNIQRYLAWGYFTGERTFLSNVFSLPPGHFLTMDLVSGEALKQCYWRFTLEPDISWCKRKEEQLCEELREKILMAVQKRLIGDVPPGLFLSGGVDSGTIASAISRLREPKSIQAFSIGFTEPSFDESTFAIQTAQHCGLSHNVETVDLNSVMPLIPDLLGRMGEPLSDSSLLPTWLLSVFTRKHVQAALSGDAGDELFAGYDPFLALRPAALYHRLVPNWLHKSARFLSELAPPSDNNMSLEFKIKRTLRGLSHQEKYWLPVWMGPLDVADLPDIFTSPLSVEELYQDVDVADGKTPLERGLLFYTRHYMPGDALVKADRAAMLASLEVRSVFLDNDIVAFCRKLPQTFKLRGNIRKYILKKAIEPWLPEALIYRRKKGFGIPLNKWMREYPLALGDLERSDIKIAGIEKRVAHHKAKRGDHRAFLWAWLSLEAAWNNLTTRPGDN